MLPTLEKGTVKVMRYFFIFISTFLILSLPFNQVFGGNREELGRGEKLRVLVDKVLMQANGWVMTENHVKQIAEAGFNVVSPREGGDDMHQVRLISQYAQKYGLYHIPWMRGTLATKQGPKLVWSNGQEQPIYSPNSDELWDWMSRMIIQYAKISVETPSLMGVFLDFENYSMGMDFVRKIGNAYPLSYDDKILKEFATEKNIVLPNLKLGERHDWLQKKGLHQDFSDFQIANWRTRAKKLRNAIDSINPQFQFCVYPIGDMLFLQNAVFQEWATGRAPLIVADAITYGRPSKYMLHKPALMSNLERLERNMGTIPKGISNILYMGGIDPVVNFADPEFSGRNAVMISEASNGYWVFYEGPEIGKDHEQYWKWFTQANLAIKNGSWNFWQEERETRDPVLDRSETSRFKEWMLESARDVKRFFTNHR